MRVLVTGSSGQLGHDIVERLMFEDALVYAPSHEEMDITNANSVKNAFDLFKPDIVYHCNDYTAVDKAEEDKKSCYDINVTGTKNIADNCLKHNSTMVYISTDYVFDGTKEGYYEIYDKPNPMNVYGETKWLGEKETERVEKHYIVRISWVFGLHGKNFVKTMLNLGTTHKELNVVDDQIGSPTYTRDLANTLLEIVNSDEYGIYHATNSGICSWADLAEYIFKVNKMNVKVNHVSTEEYLRITGAKQAYRPRNSKLSKSRLDDNNLNKMTSRHTAVTRYSHSLNKSL